MVRGLRLAVALRAISVVLLSGAAIAHGQVVNYRPIRTGRGAA